MSRFKLVSASGSLLAKHDTVEALIKSAKAMGVQAAILPMSSADRAAEREQIANSRRCLATIGPQPNNAEARQRGARAAGRANRRTRRAA